MKPETKQMLKDKFKKLGKTLWTFTKVFGGDLIAPCIVIGTIGSAAHLQGASFWVYMLSANIVYWKFLNVWSRVPIYNFKISNQFIVPDGMDADEIAEMIRLNMAPNLTKITKGQ